MHSGFREGRASRHTWRASLFLVLAIGTTVVRAEEFEPEPDSTSETSDYEGLVAHMGSVTTTFRIFGDVGAGYDSTIDEADEAKASFLAGSLDIFNSTRISDHFQTLAEIVAEFEPDTNEVGFELERIWAAWSVRDEFYLKLGREHSPVSHWNRRYHHGRILWPAVSQPFIARFEDAGGPLPIHEVGIEVGGTARTRAGAIGYAAVLSNGRGLTFGEVTNVRDRDGKKAWDAAVNFSPSGAPGLGFGVDYHSDSIPADPGNPLSLAMDEGIASIFAEYRAGRWEALMEAVSIDHQTAASGPEYQHYSGYLQVNCAFKRAAPYARVDVRDMALGDPFYSPGDLDLDRWDGVVGVRVDLGSQAAFKAEGGYGRTEVRDALGVVTKEPVAFAEISLQWGF